MPDRNAHRAVADAVARLHGAGGDGVAAHHAAGVGHRGAADDRGGAFINAQKTIG